MVKGISKALDQKTHKINSFLKLHGSYVLSWKKGKRKGNTKFEF